MSHPPVPDHSDSSAFPPAGSPPPAPAPSPYPAGSPYPAASGGVDPATGPAPRRSWWLLLLAALAAVVVGIAGGVGGAALGGDAAAGGSDAERFARGACQAVTDWELTEAEFVVTDGEVPAADGWLAASGYGMAAGLSDNQFHEFEQAGRLIQRALHRYDQDGLAEATERLADACADHGF